MFTDLVKNPNITTYNSSYNYKHKKIPVLNTKKNLEETISE